ncbi:MAG: ATP-dependent endonuclease [Ilumatobacter sp.]|nr:ATP-dependent endonuclease [Ilumatobacter sp.]
MEATAAALGRVDDATTLVLVEGVSDLIAVEALARRRATDLDRQGVVVVPIGGAQAIGRFLAEFGPGGSRPRRLLGLCDAGEEAHVRRALVRAGLGPVSGRDELEALGFFVCVDDLEDELIRACGTALVEELLEAHGDLDSFRTMQRQAAWRGRPIDRQLHRWLRAGARRHLRYSGLLLDAVAQHRFPSPLMAVLDAAVAR